MTDATEQLSLVIGVPKLTPVAAQEPASALTVTAVGAVIVGAIVSTTVTITWSEAVQPLLFPVRV